MSTNKTTSKSINLPGIPDDVHNRFKIACIKNGISMRDALLKFMTFYGKKHNPEKEKKVINNDYGYRTHDIIRNND